MLTSPLPGSDRRSAQLDEADGEAFMAFAAQFGVKG